MALPTNADLKLVLRIQGTAEDAFLTTLLARARAVVEGLIGRPITAVSDRTWVDEGERVRSYGGLIALVIPTTPIDPATLVITDADGIELLAGEDYRAPKAWDGVIRAMPGTTFRVPPYTLSADVGLSVSTDPDYATLIEPIVNAAILDVAADLYQRRSPAASSESTGGGVSTSYVDADVIARVRGMLSTVCAVRVV